MGKVKYVKNSSSNLFLLETITLNQVYKSCVVEISQIEYSCFGSSSWDN